MTKVKLYSSTGIVKSLQSLSAAQHSLYSQVVVLVILVRVMPPTNATSERSFSYLQRFKSYLQSTMTHLRLNSTMLLHVHKDLTGHLNLIVISLQISRSTDQKYLVCWKNKKEFQKLVICTSCGKASKYIHCTWVFAAVTWLSICVHYSYLYLAMYLPTS